MTQSHGHLLNVHISNVLTQKQNWNEVCQTSHTETERATSALLQLQKLDCY